MKKLTPLELAGIPKVSIKKALKNNELEGDLSELLYGNLRLYLEALPTPRERQYEASRGKRLVHIRETLSVVDYLLREGLELKSDWALVLTGRDPTLACVPWAASGLASQFVGYEQNPLVFEEITRESLLETEQEIGKRTLKLWRSSVRPYIGIYNGSCFGQPDHQDENQKFSVFDLDFCSNKVRTEAQRERIINLLLTRGHKSGPIILRTTAHVGHAGNTARDVKRHLRRMEAHFEPAGFDPVGVPPHRYNGKQRQGMTMMSKTWILERR